MNMSKKFELTKQDIMEWGRNVLVMFWPVFLLLLDQLEQGIVEVKTLIALGGSIAIDFFRRFITDYTKR